MAAQPTTNNNKTSPPNNNPTLAQANQLNPPAASNPGTTTTAPTTPVPPQFNLTECSKYLFSQKPELYKPPVPSGGWAAVKCKTISSFSSVCLLKTLYQIQQLIYFQLSDGLFLI
ncbi:uncharacterized protein PGTG_07896 [Puccinia graminis f. sp. tritici CRL 75-36-700-3]|uniref:Uncharacterized protein n=1 Tax=Puccinia graminis f. sp. tritici (strain CRL 75-36-700-3 / race SCCL) TaxID=418459 RepID=E3KBD4_PUCGT|nr:uncharacterized protein PGTG_07896 [Puccinia graminis f. sp. tritici CRL 75-36-700-3]EFP81647.1 hypothetical protein PGTG_07896 [Puccinia graminis f. sp. tritici CRL 75-36-700-3]